LVLGIADQKVNGTCKKKKVQRFGCGPRAVIQTGMEVSR